MLASFSFFDRSELLLIRLISRLFVCHPVDRQPYGSNLRFTDGHRPRVGAHRCHGRSTPKNVISLKIQCLKGEPWFVVVLKLLSATLSAIVLKIWTAYAAKEPCSRRMKFCQTSCVSSAGKGIPSSRPIYFKPASNRCLQHQSVAFSHDFPLGWWEIDFSETVPFTHLTIPRCFRVELKSPEF